MKTVQVTSWLGVRNGGILDSMRGLADGLCHSEGVAIEVLGLEEKGIGMPDWPVAMVREFPVVGPRPWGYSPGLKRAVFSANGDVTHLHGLWMYPSVAVRAWHRSTGRPHVISPHGMLDAWALANSGWRKKLAGAIFEKENLREAACLHALCEEEAEAMRAYGLRNPIAVVPNGVALPAQRCDEGRVASGESTRRKTLLFLGRLHPKKGLPEALRAWAQVARGKETGWRFVIAGWDQGGHEAELKRICSEIGVPLAEIPVAALAENCELNTENSVVFVGPAFGEAKEALLRSADAFVLPSLSEGLPMSVLEAWAYGLPVLMTEECNLPEGFAAQAAIKIAAKSEESKGPEIGERRSEPKRSADSRRQTGGQRSAGASEALRELMGMSDAERGAMGARGRSLVEERFTWPKVAAQMKEVYDWVLGAGPRPDFVRIS